MFNYRTFEKQPYLRAFGEHTHTPSERNEQMKKEKKNINYVGIKISVVDVDILWELLKGNQFDFQFELQYVWKMFVDKLLVILCKLNAIWQVVFKTGKLIPPLHYLKQYYQDIFLSIYI